MKRHAVPLLLAGVVMAALLIVQRPSAAQPQAETRKTSREVIPPSEAAPGSVVFDLKYRGLRGLTNELRYNSYWGFGGGNEAESSFLKAVKKKVKNAHAVNNPNLKGAEWSAVELKDGKAVAFYFDLNADGKLTDNERLLPTTQEVQKEYRKMEFVTPDFFLKTQDGSKVPFRVLLQVAFYGTSAPPNYMWSPSGVLEGMARINGEPLKMILFADGFSGAFDQFGRGAYSLLPIRPETNNYQPREVLSSVINYQGQFYRLQFQGRHAENQTLRAVLTKDTRPTGELIVDLRGASSLNSHLAYAMIQGVQDSTVHFGLSDGQSRLPAGTYRLDQGEVRYGVRNVPEWNVGFTEGPEAVIRAETPCTIELGNPKLTVHAIDANQRYMQGAKESARYKKGTTIYLSPAVKGKNGEVFNRFSLAASDGVRQDKPPQITITDSGGKVLVAKNMEYG